MGYPLFIGLRYLKAKRKQTFISVITFISIAGITVGVTALIIVLSVMNGFEKDLREKIIGVNAHLVVMKLGEVMTGYEETAREVRSVGGVLGATPFTYSQGMVSGPGGVVGLVVQGIDVDTTGEVTVLPEKVTVGSIEGLRVSFKDAIGHEDVLPGILLGSELARTIGAEEGDEVSLMSPEVTSSALGGGPRTAAFRVSGIFELGMYEYDSAMAFISLENSQSFFRLGDSVTGIEVKIDDVELARERGHTIQQALGGPFWTRTWMDMNKNLFSALKLEKVVMFIILALIIIVAGMNIISTLIMVVMEKGKDIAILKSLGATSSGIMQIFMIEGVIIGVVGTLLGTLFGILGAVNLESIVTVVEEIFGFKVLPPSVYYIDRLPSEVEPMAVIVIVIFSLLISFLATLYPSWQASRCNPVEGLRYE